MFEKYLQEIGLNDKEASVYLALLAFESTTVLELSKKTGIKRPTVYTALESLANKGLVSETTIGKKTNYYAETPERLETYVEKKKLHLEEAERTLKDVIPQLKSITRESGEKPIVKYFEGKEGMFSSNEEIIALLDKTDEPMYGIYPKDLVDQVFTEADLQKFKEQRTGRKIKSDTIYTSDRGDQESDSLSNRLRVDSRKYPITCDITIYKDVAIISILGKRLSAIFIKNKDVAETLKSLVRLIKDSYKKE